MGEPKFKDFPGFDAFSDVDGCKLHFEGDVDDPGALCRWLQENGKDALDDPEAEDVLLSVGTEFVSGVDNPAQDSQWLIAKDVEGPDGENHRWKSDAPLVVHKGHGVDKEDGEDERQITFAPVLIPGEADKQGDVIPEFEIERAAHNYLKNARHVDTDHDLLDGKGDPIESYTLKEDTTFTLPDGTESREYPKGTWVMGIQWANQAWKRIKSGDLNGLSIYGGAQAIPVNELIGKSADEDRQSVALDIAEKSVLSDDEADALESMVEDMAEDTDADVSEITVAEFVAWSTSDSEDEDADDGDDTEEDSDNSSDDDESDEDEETKSKSMSNEDDTPEDTGDDNQEQSKDDTPEWADDLQETMKSVGDRVDGVRDDVDSLQERVDGLEKDVNDDPKNDRMEADDGGDRMEKSADEDDADDDTDVEEVVKSTMDDYFGVEDETDRKAIREQVTKSDDNDQIDVGFDPDADEATPNGGGNPRMEDN